MKITPLLYGCLAAVAAAAAMVVLATVPFRDEHGRVINLRGFNTASSSKHSPDGMPWITCKDVVREARELGFNFVRYLIHWSHIEPQKGVYNETYLDMVSERVGWYRDNGFHIMLDIHNDIWGPVFGGNGAPEWATFTDGLPWGFVDPWPISNLQPGISHAWDTFWDTHSYRGVTLQAKYAQMVAYVATRFKSKIYGIGIMNEPFAGSTPWRIFEKTTLTSFYQHVIDVVRTVDEDILLFYEPLAFTVNQGIASCLGNIDRPNTVYAPHLYPVIMQMDGLSYTGVTRPIVQMMLENWKRERSKEASSLPLLLGEFGVIWERTGNLEYTDDVLDMMDSMGGGWAYWSNDYADNDWKMMRFRKRSVAGPGETPGLWSPYYKDGTYNPLALRLARPYARAVAGTNVTWWYDKTKHAMNLKFTLDASIKAPTEIFVPADKFPNGYLIQGADVFQQTLTLAEAVYFASLAKPGSSSSADYVSAPKGGNVSDALRGCVLLELAFAGRVEAFSDNIDAHHIQVPSESRLLQVVEEDGSVQHEDDGHGDETLPIRDAMDRVVATIAGWSATKRHENDDENDVSLSSKRDDDNDDDERDPYSIEEGDVSADHGSSEPVAVTASTLLSIGEWHQILSGHSWEPSKAELISKHLRKDVTESLARRQLCAPSVLSYSLWIFPKLSHSWIKAEVQREMFDVLLATINPDKYAIGVLSSERDVDTKVYLRRMSLVGAVISAGVLSNVTAHLPAKISGDIPAEAETVTRRFARWPFTGKHPMTDKCRQLDSRMTKVVSGIMAVFVGAGSGDVLFRSL
ncbi:glycoside hydrolase [Ramicandelaber brevisporus]|nr:glycoside hydrolase [Ramicandelaber brevisporus]